MTKPKFIIVLCAAIAALLVGCGAAGTNSAELSSQPPRAEPIPSDSLNEGIQEPDEPSPSPTPEPVYAYECKGAEPYILSNGLEYGMSYEDVVSIMGQPDYILSKGFSESSVTLFYYEMHYWGKAVITLSFTSYELDDISEIAQCIDDPYYLEESAVCMIQICSEGIATQLGIECGDSLEELLSTYDFTEATLKEYNEATGFTPGAWRTLNFLLIIQGGYNNNDIATDRFEKLCLIQTAPPEDYSLSRGLAFFLTDDQVECIMIYLALPRETNPTIAFTDFIPIPLEENPVVPTSEPIAAVTSSTFSVYDGPPYYGWGKTVLAPAKAKELLELLAAAELDGQQVDCPPLSADTSYEFKVVYTNGDTETFLFAKDEDSGTYRIYKNVDGGYLSAEDTGLAEFIRTYLEW